MHQRGVSRNPPSRSVSKCCGALLGTKRSEYRRSKIIGREASLLRDPGEHARPDFLVVVKREDEIRPAIATQSSMRARRAFDVPADSKESRENPAGLRR
jgi:hypothetical protein